MELLPQRARPLEPDRPLPSDVKRAIVFMRGALGQPLAMSDLARHCGVPQRTLNNHFRAFLGHPPMRYLQRLRLAAAREALLAGASGTSVTDVAKRFCFNHLGRFSEQYRRAFGEAPSATLRAARIVAVPIARAERGETAVTPPPSRERPSVAVLPCAVPANEPALRWMSESLAAATAAALSSVRSLSVRAARAQASSCDPHRIARELNVRYLLIGRLAHDSARVRVILHLADVATGRHLWGESFDGERDQPLALQDRIVAAIMRTLPLGIRGAEIERARCVPPRNLDAHGLAMRAVPYIFASRPEATRRALELLYRAIEIDPDYGVAAALAAWGHGQLVMYNGTHTPATDAAHAAGLNRRAAILDDDDPLALTARAAVHTMAREFDAAEALVARALASEPSFGWAWGRSGWLHAYRGESETAIDHFRRAALFDGSVSVRVNSLIGTSAAHFHAERYEEAATCLRTALREQPDLSWANRSLSVSYARLGERSLARESLDALRRFSPDLTTSQVVAAVPFAPDFLDRLGDGLSGLGLPP